MNVRDLATLILACQTIIHSCSPGTSQQLLLSLVVEYAGGGLYRGHVRESCIPSMQYFPRCSREGSPITVTPFAPRISPNFCSHDKCCPLGYYFLTMYYRQDRGTKSESCTIGKGESHKHIFTSGGNVCPRARIALSGV